MAVVAKSVKSAYRVAAVSGYCCSSMCHQRTVSETQVNEPSCAAAAPLFKVLGITIAARS